MKRKVRITSMPKAQSGFEIKMNAGMGFNANQLSWPVMAGEFSAKDIKTRSTILPSSWEGANLEAEKGETVVTDLNQDGITEHYRIGGKRHYEGGTPLNLPEDSFIFSRDRSMKIKDEDVLKMFNKTYRRSGYTPADLAKQYDINKFREVLADPDSDDLQRKTAEMMIANYNLKLGKLSLAQESLKGFPQGVPKIAMPYIESINMDPIQGYTQTQGQPEQPDGDNMARYGKEVKGSLPKARKGLFGNRSARPAGMRFNSTTGVYEVLDRDGNVIGIGNPGQDYNIPMNPNIFQGDPTTTSETTTKTKVKKQVLPKNAKVIDRSQYKTDEEYTAARDAAFKEANGKYKVYTKASDGKYYTVGEKSVLEGKDVAGRLEYLKERISDPKVAEALKQKVIELSKDKAANKKGLTEAKINAMKPEEIVDQFLEMNERNLKVAQILGKEGYNCYDNKGNFIKGKGGCDAETGKKYPNLDTIYKEVGLPISATGSGGKAALQQLIYLGYEGLINDKKAGKIKDADINTKLEGFEVEQLGVSDEDIGRGGKKSKISGADDFYTNTTAGQVAGITGMTPKEDLLAETEIEEQQKRKKQQLIPFAKSTRAPFFAQDILGVSKAFGDWATITGTPPWQAAPATYMNEAVLVDPSQSIAATTSMANTLGRQLGTFAGGKKLSSQASDILGKLAAQSSAEIANYANTNVGIMNNYLAQKNNLLNQASRERAGLATNLYDKQTMFNQQLENDRRAALQNFTNAYTTALTNKVNAYNTNLLSENYQITPESGGQIVFTGATGPIVPDAYDGTDSVIEKFKTYKEMLPGTDDKVIWDMIQGKSSSRSKNQELEGMIQNTQGMIS
jgi:hypothetical protein